MDIYIFMSGPIIYLLSLRMDFFFQIILVMIGEIVPKKVLLLQTKLFSSNNFLIWSGRRPWASITCLSLAIQGDSSFKNVFPDCQMLEDMSSFENFSINMQKMK